MSYGEFPNLVFQTWLFAIFTWRRSFARIFFSERGPFTVKKRPLFDENDRAWELQILMGLFRGSVFDHGRVAYPSALMSCFASLMGRFPTLVGRFPRVPQWAGFLLENFLKKRPIKIMPTKRLNLLRKAEVCEYPNSQIDAIFCHKSLCRHPKKRLRDASSDSITNFLRVCFMGCHTIRGRKKRVITKGVFSPDESLEPLKSLDSLESPPPKKSSDSRILLCFPQSGGSLESLDLSAPSHRIRNR